MPVVGRDQLGQLGIGGVGTGLDLVDLFQQTGQQAGRVAADLAGSVRGSSSMRSSSRARRSAGPSTSKKGSSPAAVECSRRMRSQSCSQVPIQSSSRGRSSSCLDPLAQALCGSSRRCEYEDSVRRRPVIDEALEAAGQDLGLAGSRIAAQQERPGAVADRALLGLGEGQCRVGHDPTLPGRPGRAASIGCRRWTSSPQIGRRSAAASSREQETPVRADART